MDETDFEWDETKNLDNQRKHGISFDEAQFAFLDVNRVIAKDLDHSQDETRYYCFGLNKERKVFLLSGLHIGTVAFE